MNENKLIAIVIPVYNECRILNQFYERLNSIVLSQKKYRWEFIFVNDGSSDKSLDILNYIAQRDLKVTVLDLSRNFGKEVALTAGVQNVNYAHAVICIDADLQHPPELIPRLIEEWEEGAEVVVTIRTSTEKKPFLRRLGSHGYYWLMSKISGLEMQAQTTDFRLYDRKVVAAFCLATERERMFRGIMDWMGFRRKHVQFKADARAAGEAGYSYSKLWALAINSITSFSLWPLRLTGYLGVAITIFSGLMLLWMLGDYALGSVMNFTPLAIVMMTNTFLIGIVLIAIGLIALYIGVIHTEVINRPLYIIRERINYKANAMDLRERK